VLLRGGTYTGVMRLILTVTILAVLAPACIDDLPSDTLTTTDSIPGNTEPVITLGGTEPPPTTGAATTIDLSTSSSGDDSSTTLPTTSDGTTEFTTGFTTGGDPILGCAHFVELNMNVAPDDRHIVIDASGCSRTSSLTMHMTLLTGFGVQNFDLGTGVTCGSFGGSNSPAKSTMSIMPNEPDLPAFMLELRVDDVVVDMLRVPAILKDPSWKTCPTTPIRRAADDETWVVIPEPIDGCVLL